MFVIGSFLQRLLHHSSSILRSCSSYWAPLKLARCTEHPWIYRSACQPGQLFLHTSAILFCVMQGLGLTICNSSIRTTAHASLLRRSFLDLGPPSKLVSQYRARSNFQIPSRSESSEFTLLQHEHSGPRAPPMPCPYWLRAHKSLRAARAVPMGSPIQCRSAVPISTIGRVLPSRRVGPRGGFRTQLNTERPSPQ